MKYKIKYLNQQGGAWSPPTQQGGVLVLTDKEIDDIMIVLEIDQATTLIDDLVKNLKAYLKSNDDLNNIDDAIVWVINNSKNIIYQRKGNEGEEGEQGEQGEQGVQGVHSNIFFGDDKIDLSIMDNGGKKKRTKPYEYSKIYGRGDDMDRRGEIQEVLMPHINENIKKLKNFNFDLKIIEFQQYKVSNPPNSEGYKLIVHKLISDGTDYKYDFSKYILDETDDKIDDLLKKQDLIILGSPTHYTIYYTDNIKKKVKKFFKTEVFRQNNKKIDQIMDSDDNRETLCDFLSHLGNRGCGETKDIELPSGGIVYVLKKIDTSDFVRFKNKLSIPSENDICYIISIFSAIFLSLPEEDSIKLWNLYFNNPIFLIDLIKRCNQ